MSEFAGPKPKDWTPLLAPSPTPSAPLEPSRAWSDDKWKSKTDETLQLLAAEEAKEGKVSAEAENMGISESSARMMNDPGIGDGPAPRSYKPLKPIAVKRGMK